MINPSAGGRINLEATVEDGPRYAASSARLTELRRARTTRMIMRELYSGCWLKVLIESGKTQHYFQDSEKGSNRHPQEVGPLIQKFNVFKLACQVHADFNAIRPPLISVDDDLYPDQAEAMRSIADRSLLDSMYHRACLRTGIEGASIVTACIDADILSPQRGAVLALGDNDEWLPVGPIGPDGQPRVWERRWIVSRTINGREQNFLRVERYWSPNGVVTIDNEAYKVEGTETIVDLGNREKCKRVELAEAIGQEAAANVPPIREIGTEFVPVIWLLRYINDEGMPEGLIGADDLDLLDEVMGAFSQWSRSRSLHSTPKMRIGEKHVDAETGQATARFDMVVDPDKLIEYITAEFQLEKILQSLDRTLGYALAQMQVSTMLLGLDPAGGVAETFESRRLKSMSTLASAMRSVPVQGPPMSRVCECACVLEAQLPGNGWPTGPVEFTPRPEVPKETIDIAREQRELIEGKLTSRRRAVAAVHGEDLAEEVLEEIAEDEAAESSRQRASIFGAIGSDPFGDSRAETTAPDPEAEDIDPEGDASTVPGQEVLDA